MERPNIQLQALLAEQQKSYQPFSRKFTSALGRANRAWENACVDSFKARKNSLEGIRSYADAGMKATLRHLARDTDYLEGLTTFGDRGRQMTLDVAEDAVVGLDTMDLVTTQEMLEIIMLAVTGFEETLDVFGPPYARQGTELQGGPHKQHIALADRNAGTFGFTHNIGHEGGESYAAAALWSSFMRRSPGSPPGQGSVGLAQVRCYVPYLNKWDTQSFIAPAHNRAGFGVFVSSEDLGGGDFRIEQDHRYLWLNDSTDWYKAHGNPAAPDSDSDTALNYNHQAPHFIIRPGRIYSVAVWCFGSCDAHGASIEQASFAASLVRARIPLCIVAQSKN